MRQDGTRQDTPGTGTRPSPDRPFTAACRPTLACLAQLKHASERASALVAGAGRPGPLPGNCGAWVACVARGGLPGGVGRLEEAKRFFAWGVGWGRTGGRRRTGDGRDGDGEGACVGVVLPWLSHLRSGLWESVRPWGWMDAWPELASPPGAGGPWAVGVAGVSLRVTTE